METPVEAGLRSAACGSASSVCVCKSVEPEAAAVLDHQLEAAGDAQAGDRRCAEDRDDRVLDLAARTPGAAGP